MRNFDLLPHKIHRHLHRNANKEVRTFAKRQKCHFYVNNYIEFCVVILGYHKNCKISIFQRKYFIVQSHCAILILVIEMEEKKKKAGYKRKGQKYKSLLVAHMLMRLSDEDHALKTSDIIENLSAYGIEAEQHSINRDIRDLQELFDKDFSADIDDNERLNYEISYDTKARGYKITNRPIDFDDLQLLANCVYSSKFITDKQVEELINALSGLGSVHQIESLKKNVYSNKRAKTKNTEVVNSTVILNNAIKENKKISFKYYKYTLADKEKPIERRNEPYIVSPFRLMMNDGNFYLLAFAEKENSMRTYRLDRMKSVNILETEREGEEEFKKLNIETYAKRAFSMFNGEEKRVNIQFTASKLDTVIDRFGTGADTTYIPKDKHHFTLSANIAVSDAFYSWLTSFGTSAVILYPQEVIDGYKNFLEKIQKKYEPPQNKG